MRAAEVLGLACSCAMSPCPCLAPHPVGFEWGWGCRWLEKGLGSSKSQASPASPALRPPGLPQRSGCPAGRDSPGIGGRVGIGGLVPGRLQERCSHIEGRWMVGGRVVFQGQNSRAER